MDDLRYAHHAKTALAASHTAARPALYPVNGHTAQRSVYGLLHFGLRHRLTAADDFAVSGVFRRGFGALLVRHVCKACNGLSFRNPVYLVWRAQILLDALGQLFPDGRRTRQPWAFNAQRMVQPLHLGVLSHEEIPCQIMRAQPAELCNQLPARDVWHGQRSGRQHIIQSFLGGRCIRLVFNILCRGAHQKVAVHRRRHQNTLAHFCWQLKQRFGRQSARRLVKEHIFALSRPYRPLNAARHFGDFVCIQTSCIDDGPGFYCLIARRDPKPVFHFLYRRHRRFKHKFYAVLRRALAQRNTCFIRAGNPARRRMQRRYDLGIDVRLHGQYLVAL